MTGPGAERTADRKPGCLWQIKARLQESGKWEGAVSRCDRGCAETTDGNWQIMRQRIRASKVTSGDANVMM